MPAFNYKQEYERYKKYYLSLEPILNKSENRAYTSVIFSFLAVSLFGWYAIRPTMQTIFTLKREISDRTFVDKQMEDKISALIEAQATFENVQNDIPVLTDALPRNPDPIGAATQLRGMADETGVAITGMSVPAVDLVSQTAKSAAASGGKIMNVPLTLSVSGTYAQVKQFLKGVMNLRRITQITDMSFSPRTSASPSVTIASPSGTPAASGSIVQVDLKLQVFYITW